MAACRPAAGSRKYESAISCVCRKEVLKHTSHTRASTQTHSCTHTQTLAHTCSGIHTLMCTHSHSCTHISHSHHMHVHTHSSHTNTSPPPPHTHTVTHSSHTSMEICKEQQKPTERVPSGQNWNNLSSKIK